MAESMPLTMVQSELGLETEGPEALPESKQGEVVICVLKWGAVYQYTIPGFSVITVPLRHAEVQAQQLGNEILLLDVFFRDEPLLDTNPLPFMATIVEACLVEVGYSYVFQYMYEVYRWTVE